MEIKLKVHPIKYREAVIPPGAELFNRVKTQKLKVENEELKTDNDNNSKILIEIKDTGIGISVYIELPAE